jgi:hypothetical protein
MGFSAWTTPACPEIKQYPFTGEGRYIPFSTQTGKSGQCDHPNPEQTDQANPVQTDHPLSCI